MKHAPMKTIVWSATISTVLLVGAVWAPAEDARTESGTADGAGKPSPPPLTKPGDAETKNRPAPADYKPGSDNTGSEKTGDEKPAFADNGTPEDAADEATAQKRQIDALKRRLATLENLVDTLQAQMRKTDDDNLKLQKATSEALVAVKDGLLAQKDSLAKLTVDLKKVTQDLDDMGKAQTTLARSLEGVTSDLSTITADVKSVRKDLNGVTSDLEQVARDLNSSLSHVARFNPDTGKWQRLRAYSQSTVPGRDGTSVGVDVIPATQGKLVFVNGDNVAEKVLQINGTPWRVRTGRSYIWVPMGTVSIASPGFEPTFLDRWRYNPVSGQMELEYRF